MITITQLLRRSSPLVVAALLLLARSGFAQTLYTSFEGYYPNFGHSQQSTTVVSLSDEFDFKHGPINENVQYGSATIRGTIDLPPDAGDDPARYSGYSAWDDVFTFNNPALTGQQGVARFTMHLTGGFAVSTTGGDTGQNGYTVYSSGPSPHFNVGGRTYSDGSFQGTPPSTLETFSFDVAFTYGQPVLINFALSNDGDFSVEVGVLGSGSTSSDFTLASGGYIILDAQNQPVDFTGESQTGSARGTNFAPGTPFGGFTLTNTAPGRVGTTVSLIDGTPSGPANVTATFVAPPPGVQQASDPVDFCGTGTDPVVIQMNYDPALAQTLFGGETGLRLGWLNPATGHWVKAVAGNVGGIPNFLNRGYNPATDFQLGNFGLDTVNHVVWAVINHCGVFGVADPLALTAAVSRKTHAGAGPFDINLPLTGTPATECRTGGASGDHMLVFTFANNVVSGNASVTAGVGSVVGTPTFAGNTMTVNLTGVTNAQTVAVTLSNVTDSFSQVLPDTAVSAGFLLGDTNGNRSVNASDVSQTKSRNGQTVDATNFRSDVNANGAINAGDIANIKSHIGTGLP